MSTKRKGGLTRRDRDYMAMFREDLLWPPRCGVPKNIKPRQLRLLILTAYSVGQWAQQRTTRQAQRAIAKALWTGRWKVDAAQ